MAPLRSGVQPAGDAVFAPLSTAPTKSLFDAVESRPPAGDQLLYRVLTATEAPDNLRLVPDVYASEPLQKIRLELIDAVALLLALSDLVGFQV